MVKLIKRVEKYGEDQKPKEFNMLAEENQAEKLLKDPNIRRASGKAVSNPAMTDQAKAAEAKKAADEKAAAEAKAEE